MLQYDGEPASQSKPAALKTDKKTLDWINKEEREPQTTTARGVGSGLDTVLAERNAFSSPGRSAARPGVDGRSHGGIDEM